MCGLHPVMRVLFQASADQPRDLRGQVTPEFRNRLFMLPHDRSHQGGPGIAAERPSTRRHLVHHDAEGEDVGALIQRLRFDLFGRHVRHGPEDGPGAGEPLLGDHVLDIDEPRAFALGSPRQTEVENLHEALARHHDVHGGEVAVGDVLVMSGGEGIGHGDRNVEELRQGQAAFRDHAGEGAAFDQFHGDEGRPVRFFDGEDGHDMRVVERGHRVSLPGEAGQADGIAGRRLRHHLDGDVPTQTVVARAINLAHAAGSDDRGDFVGPQMRPLG